MIIMRKCAVVLISRVYTISGLDWWWTGLLDSNLTTILMTSMYAATKISLINFQAVLRAQLWLYVANISTEFLSVWLQFGSGECGPSPIIGVGRW